MNERLTKDIERPELTERKYKAINTCYYNSPAACADKLGLYENIDTDPTHLAKIKLAFEIIKEKNVAITMIKQTGCVEEYNQFAYGFLPIKEVKNEKYVLSPQPLEREEYDLLKEVEL